MSPGRCRGHPRPPYPSPARLFLTGSPRCAPRCVCVGGHSRRRLSLRRQPVTAGRKPPGPRGRQRLPRAGGGGGRKRGRPEARSGAAAAAGAGGAGGSCLRKKPSLSLHRVGESAPHLRCVGCRLGGGPLPASLPRHLKSRFGCLERGEEQGPGPVPVARMAPGGAPGPAPWCPSCELKGEILNNS